MSKKKVYGYAASGGGAKGAWGGGVSQYLIHELKRDYKYLAGSSTGALLMNMVAIGDLSRGKEAYTSVNNEDIYKLCPYTVTKNQNGVFETKLNYWKIAWNIFIRKQKTFGDSTKLREILLPKFFTREIFENIKHGKKKKELIACVTNLTLGQSELKSSADYEYEDFLDWVFASTCAAPFMSVVEKERCEYVDGGYIEHTPIQVLIDRGCTEIDIIDHKSPELPVTIVRNPLHMIGRMVDVMMWENAINDLHLAKLKARDEDVVLNIYHPQRKLTNNSLVFDKETMADWWDEGHEFAKMGLQKSFVLQKGRKLKLI